MLEAAAMRRPKAEGETIPYKSAETALRADVAEPCFILSRL
jgi:hypothetical protein